MKTKKEIPNISIRFGALPHQIKKQLADQGFRGKTSALRKFQDWADWLTILSIDGLLTQREVGNARRRLMKRILKGVEADL